MPISRNKSKNCRFSLCENENMRAASIGMGIAADAFRLILQWVRLPLIAYRAENLKKREE